MHLIHQNIFEFNCASKQTGRMLQDNLSQLLEKEFFPKLEILLDRYEVKGHVWEIDQLVLELPEINVKNWKKDLFKSILDEVEKYLKFHQPKFPDQGKSESEIFYSETKKREKIFFQFLQTGIISENTISKKQEEIFSKIEVNDHLIENLILLFEENYNTVTRFYFNISATLKNAVKETSFKINIPKKWEFFFNDEVKFENISALEIWLNNFEKENSSKENFKNEKVTTDVLFKRNLKINEKSQLNFERTKTSQDLSPRNKLTKKEKEANDFANKKSENEKISQNSAINPEILKDQKSGNEVNHQFLFEENIYLENAGLVILHPFLKPLFEQSNLSKNDLWISKESQHKAVLLTQYLIIGKAKIFENELVLNKLLCGLPIETVINTQLQISDLEKEKCENLLEAILEHWKSLKGTSKEGLQETFLRRNGKLSIHNSSELWVEEKGVDILLQHLPWGIGTIKTPWMNEFLTCNWL